MKNLRSAAAGMVPWFLIAGATIVGAFRVPAQCTNVWLPGDGMPGADGRVWATTTWDPDGAGPATPVLVVGGAFTLVGSALANRIAIWDPASGTWSPLGSGMNDRINALATLPNGDLVAGGSFTVAGGVSASRIARWSGASWSALGSGVNLGFSGVNALISLPNGDLVAGGNFFTAGGVSVNYIARWNGTSWGALGSGMYWYVHALTTIRNGDLVAGGAFTTAGGVVSAYLARLTTTCPATATSLGSGCSSSVGPMVLAANTLPWVGSTFRSTCTAMAPGSLGFGLFGFTSPGTPLSLLHPAGGVGCGLLASPDSVLRRLPGGGTVSNQFGIPLDPVFAGVVLHNQVLQIELGPTFQITRIGSSNGLMLTLGVF